MNIGPEQVRALLVPRNPSSHKGTYGHALLVAGSYGKIGAAVLASGACLRSGVGLLTAYIPNCGYNILQGAVPEAMVLTDDNARFITTATDTGKYDAVGVGPGLGMEEATQQAFHQLLMQTKHPMVVDADALNILGLHKEWLEALPPNSILTPHPKEFERIAGPWKDEAGQQALQVELSRRYQLYVVLKGAGTCISTPGGETFINTTGNPGMATAGSGDVLTGVLTALLAQGYHPLSACKIGVYLHGYAGDLAAAAKGQIGMIAGDIRDHLPAAFKMFSPPAN